MPASALTVQQFDCWRALKFQLVPALRFIPLDLMEAEGYGEYIEQVEVW